MLTKFIRLLSYLFGKEVIVIANLTSILAFLIIALSEKNQATIALVAFIIFLMAILVKLFSFTSKYLELKNKRGYDSIATHFYYKTLDAKIINYEVQKYIVCKSAIMEDFEHPFSWSGQNQPVMSSDNMNFISIDKSDNGQFDKALFKLKKPLVYNESVIADIKMTIDDRRQLSETYISGYVRESISLLKMTAELAYKSANTEPAKLLKKKLGSYFDAPYHYLADIPYDLITHSYKVELYNPEIGYSYRLEWNR